MYFAVKFIVISVNLCVLFLILRSFNIDLAAAHRLLLEESSASSFGPLVA